MSDRSLWRVLLGGRCGRAEILALLIGNEYFCEVDEEYIVDRFNLTGLNAEVPGYSHALELITDTAADDDLNDEQRDQLETSARHLYGLIHARFIITSRGLSKMVSSPLIHSPSIISDRPGPSWALLPTR